MLRWFVFKFISWFYKSDMRKFKPFLEEKCGASYQWLFYILMNITISKNSHRLFISKLDLAQNDSLQKKTVY